MAKTYTDRAPGTKAVRLDLTEEQHARLRVVAAQAGLPMSQYAKMLVMDGVDDAEKNSENRRVRS